MGASAKAHIFFGISLEQISYTDKINDAGDFFNHYAVDQEICIDNCFEEEDRFEKETGLTILADGDISNDVCTYYLAVKESVQYGDWDESSKLDVSRLQERTEWFQLLMAFCEKYEITMKAIPCLRLICSL